MTDIMRRFRLAFLIAAGAGLSHGASIAGVYNAAAWIPPGLPNSGVAQGAIFTVTGSGIGPSSLVQAQSYPLPTTQGLAGVTMKVTVGAVTENCVMVYVSAAQDAAILPSATPLGTGTLTISYQGATASLAIVVQAANFGTFTLNEGGSGPAVITDTAYNPITMINAAHPGDTLILWGTGLGAVSGDETEPPVETDLGTGAQVFVGNQQASVLYAGRSSSPGLDQIDFVVPISVTGGCKTSVAVLVKGVTGNVTTTSIAPSGQTTCGDTLGILTAANMQKAAASGSLSVGLVELSRIGAGDDELTAGFGVFPTNSLIRSYAGSYNPSLNSCVAYEVSGQTFELTDPVKSTLINGGASLTINGPLGTKTVPAVTTGDYSTILATPPSTYIQPGSYSVSNGAGGSNVGAFTWNLTAPAPVTPTNLPATVTRSQNLTLTWSGGSAFQAVAIFGTSGLVTTAPISSFVQFLCTAPGAAGSFTVPSVILNLLPPNGFGSTAKPGVDLEIAGIPIQTFSVAGSPGVDAGLLSVYVSTGGVASLK